MTRRSKRPGSDSADDRDEVLFWFTNHLMSYFADDGDDEEIIRTLRDDVFPGYPFVEANFRRGLQLALAMPGPDTVRIVQDYANRHAPEEQDARAWLRTLQEELFAPGR